MAEIVVNSDHMEISVEGLTATKRYLHNLDNAVRVRLKKSFVNVGLLVQREARRRAPYKEGNLERSIDYEAQEDQVRVFVPLNSPAGRYAYQKHEGTYNPGAGTRAKGPHAGRKYIKRAIDENADKISLQFRTVIDKL